MLSRVRMKKAQAKATPDRIEIPLPTHSLNMSQVQWEEWYAPRVSRFQEKMRIKHDLENRRVNYQFMASLRDEIIPGEGILILEYVEEKRPHEKNPKEEV